MSRADSEADFDGGHARPGLPSDGVARQFLACLAAGGLLILPIILFVHRYIDDYGRSMDGSYYWLQVGRPLAEGLFGLVNLGAPSVAVAPLHQLLAVSVLALTAVIAARAYGLRSPLWTPLATLPLIGQPYGLENLSYGFDSFFMATALSLAVVAAVLVHRLPTRLGLLMSALMLLGCFCLYQPATSAFLAFALMLVLAEVLGLSAGVPEAPSVQGRIGRVFGTYGLSLLGYALLWNMVLLEQTSYAAEQGQRLPIGPDLPARLLDNSLELWRVILDDWQRWPVVFPCLLLVLSYALVVWMAVGRLSFRNRRPLARFGRWSLVILAVAVIGLVSPGAMLGLKDPLARVPRIQMFLGPLLSSMTLQIVAAVTTVRRTTRRGLLAAVPLVGLVTFAWLLVVFAYAYGHAYAAQSIYEQGRISRLIDGISRLQAQLPSAGITTIGFRGTMPMSPVLQNSQEKFPLLGRLVPRLIDNDWSWGPKQVQFHGLPLLRRPMGVGDFSEGPCIPSSTSACTAEYSLRVRGSHLLVRLE